MDWAFVWIAVGCLAALLLVGWRRRRLQVSPHPPRSHVPPAPPPLFFTPERIEEAAQRLSEQLSDDPEDSPNMLPHDGAPDGYQWMQLLMAEPQLAHSLIHELYLRLYRQGVAAAETITIVSILHYHAAHIVMSRRDPATLPRPQMWAAYPTQDEWERIVRTDYERARRLLFDLELREARFGAMYAPSALRQSMTLGRQALQNRQGRRETD